MSASKSSKLNFDLKGQNLRLHKENKALKQKISDLEDNIITKNVTLETLKDKISTLTQNNLNLKTTITKLKQSFRQETNKINLLNKRIIDKEYECLILKNEIVDMRIIDTIVPNCIKIIDDEISITKATLRNKLIFYCVVCRWL